MACNIHTLAGIAGSCEASVGGIVEVYINHWDGVTATVTENKISAIATGTEKFHKYAFKRNTGSMTSTWTIDPVNGTNFVQTDVALVFHKQDTTKRLEMTALTLDETVVIVKDANGKYWYLGYNEPVMATAAAGTSGTNRTDANNYTITLSDVSLEAPYEVDAEAMKNIVEA